MSLTTSCAAAPLPSLPGLELQEKIGEGGMSVIYRAVHRNLQRTVAVKLLRATADEATLCPTWLRESRLMASLAHPHVVAIHDAGQVEGCNYLVMEYMAGGSLRSKMEPGQPWPLNEAAKLVDHIAGALGHIHAQGVLHLDLKPENILYDGDGRTKITDFGLSIPHEDAHSILGGHRFQGTIDYCGPEYRSGLVLDGRFDVFSLATLTYELLTGRLPGRVYFPASRRNPRLPKTIDVVLRRGLARVPGERYASAGQFQQALARACRSARSRGPRWFLAVLASAAVLAAIALAAYRWWPAADPKSGLPTSGPVEAASLDRPDRLMVIYDKPADLPLFAGEDGEELASGSAVNVERVAVEKPLRKLPSGIPLSVWPTPLPALLIHSPKAWGFVHPLQDRSLGQRAVKHWPDLLRAVVPPERNLVKAGGFGGNCLATNHEGDLWRVGKTADWNATRRITLDQSDNPALLLTNLDPAQSNIPLGCYQTLAIGASPGEIVVLRYRARSLHGKGSIAVYAGMPVVVPASDMGASASRIRAFATPLPPEPGDPDPDQWMYRIPAWITPTQEWQTYLVILESPPFPTRVLHRKLVIDVAAAQPAAADQVWVDDVELFLWQPGTKP